MKESIYFDTTALAKWYIPATGSEEIEAFIIEHGPLTKSSLDAFHLAVGKKHSVGCSASVGNGNRVSCLRIAELGFPIPFFQFHIKILSEIHVYSIYYEYLCQHIGM